TFRAVIICLKMSGSPEGVYEPGIVDPGLPVTNSTLPFWHSDLHPVAVHRSAWPHSIVDVVIIGSGISGASIAHNLLSRRPDVDIPLIDARSLCSGATARNGGHIKTMTYAVWNHRKKRLGLEEAIKMTAFEHSHLEVMAHIIHTNSLECDLVPVQGVDAYYDEKVFAKAVSALQDMRLHAPKLADKYTVCTDTTVLQRAMKLSARCIGAITTPAASVWPYKMVTNLLETLARSDKVNIQTGTSVLSIDDRPGSPFATVRTSRGDIRAKAVLHATNGWLGHLLPELRPFISPVRGNVVHYGPVASKEDASGNAKSALGLDSKYSFWLRYADKDYDYLIQRQDGGIVVGPVDGSSAYITDSWSGILGFTQDTLPFVGPLATVFPSRHRQWVCSGFHGVGMVKAWRAGEMVAQMLLDETLGDEYPKSMMVTAARMKALRASLGENLEIPPRL
ncbi:hypothetical protein BN1723_005961, partial [Verticillium longisporum]